VDGWWRADPAVCGPVSCGSGIAISYKIKP
jgi:hypothetical protein